MNRSDTIRPNPAPRRVTPDLFRPIPDLLRPIPVAVRPKNPVVLIFLAMAGMLHTEPVRAQLLGFQAETQYDFTQTKRRGLSASGRGRFSTNYTLTLRRPFLPTSTLMSDLSFNSTETGDYTGSQKTKGWTLNLYANQPKYMLSSRIGHSTYGTSSDLVSSTNGYTTDYTASLFLRQPAYPVLNLQFQRNLSGSSYAGSTGDYRTTSWMMSSSYDLSPLRFSVDRIRQTYGYSGSPGIRMNRQTSAITLNHSLLPGLMMYGELSKSTVDVGYAASSTSTDTNRRLLRLTATPMRSTVADISLSSQSVGQTVGLLTGENNDHSLSWDVRSEILPGLSVDYGDQRQSLTGSAYLGAIGSTSRNRDLSVSARLAEGTVFNVSKTRTTYDVDAPAYHSQQDSIQSALQTSLTPTTDASLIYGKSKSTAGPGNVYDSTFQSVSLRDRTSTRLSVGATYRRNKVRSSVTTGDWYIQNGDAADLDLLWQPNYDVGLNLRMSYQTNRGSGKSKAFAPSGNLRWQIDTQTSMTASYTVQSFQQYDPSHTLLFGQDTRGLSFRLTHGFANGSNLDVIYGYQASNIAETEWRRQLTVSFTMVP